MGRRGKDWKKIKAFSIMLDQEILTIDLDSREKINKDIDINIKLKISKNRIAQEDNNTDSNEQNKQPNEIVQQKSDDFSTIDDPFFERQCFLMDFDDASLINDSFLFGCDTDSITDFDDY